MSASGQHMSRYVGAAAVLALLLAGCVSVRVGPDQTMDIGGTNVTLMGTEGFRPSAVTTPNPNQPNVFIVGGRIVVDQEPLRPRDESGGHPNRILVSWALDYSGNYIFPTDTAITFAGGAPAVACRRGPRNRVIGCVFAKPAVLPAQWKYNITVRNEATGAVHTLDPSVVMD